MQIQSKIEVLKIPKGVSRIKLPEGCKRPISNPIMPIGFDEDYILFHPSDEDRETVLTWSESSDVGKETIDGMVRIAYERNKFFDRIRVLEFENVGLESLLEQCKKKLSEAEKVIERYGDPAIYQCFREDWIDNEYNRKCLPIQIDEDKGHKAREYFKGGE